MHYLARVCLLIPLCSACLPAIFPARAAYQRYATPELWSRRMSTYYQHLIL